MKNLYALVVLLCLSVAAVAQMRVPASSPAASVSQVVGVTKISIDYSAPAAKGRKVWGELVPFGKAWRAGANSPTKITFEDEVTIMGKTLKAGSYSIFITPQDNADWTVYLDPSGKSVFDYKEADTTIVKVEGIVSFKVSPQESTNDQERLSYKIEANTDDKTGTIVMEWAKKRISIPVSANTTELTKKSIEAMFGSWYNYATAAKFYAENGQDLDKAKDWAEASLKLRDHFFNKWAMAIVMSKKGDKAKALEYAKAAKEFGDKNPSGFYDAYKKDIEQAVESWK